MNFHCTGRLPCVKIEVGGVNVAVITRMHVLFAYIPYGIHHSGQADAMECGTETFEGKEILGDLIFEGPKKIVKNWSSIDTWPRHLPFQTVESVPGR